MCVLMLLTERKLLLSASVNQFFLIKDAISLCQPACVQHMQVIFCCLTEGLLACGVLGQPPRAAAYTDESCAVISCVLQTRSERWKNSEGRTLPLQLQF